MPPVPGLCEPDEPHAARQAHMENVTATVALFMVQGGSISHALARPAGEGGPSAMAGPSPGRRPQESDVPMAARRGNPRRALVFDRGRLRVAAARAGTRARAARRGGPGRLRGRRVAPGAVSG